MIALCLLLIAAEAVPARAEQVRWVMGSPLRVTGTVDAEALDRAFDRARELEDLLSTWRDDTPLAHLNAAGEGRHPVSCELRDYLDRVIHDFERTDGWFDPSVGSLREGANTAPGMDALDAAEDGCSVVLPADPFAIDPGGDGKGLAVDAMVAILREAGASDVLIDFGGSSWFAFDHARVVVSANGDAPVGSVDLNDRALSVSSTTRRDAGTGETTHHLIDPRSGEVVTADRTVAVVAPQATDAEVISTAVAVAGHERAKAWLHRFDDVELVVVEDGEVIVAGPSFRRRR